jgi:hypothetical protein
MAVALLAPIGGGVTARCRSPARAVGGTATIRATGGVGRPRADRAPACRGLFRSQTRSVQSAAAAVLGAGDIKHVEAGGDLAQKNDADRHGTNAP